MGFIIRITFVILAGLVFFLSQASLGTEGHIRVGMAGFPISTLYYLGYDEYSEAITSLVLEPLITLDLDSLQPLPALAAEFNADSALTRFEFTLNSRATFSDGSKVTTEDVLATWNALRNSGKQATAYADLFSSINNCKILSPQKIVFTSQLPVAAGVGLFSQLYVMPKHLLAGKSFVKDFNEQFVGSGPYQFDKVIWGKSISLVKNKKYWGALEPANRQRYQLEKVEFIAQPDPTALFQMLLRHQIDYMYFLSAHSWAKDTQNPNFKVGAIKKMEVKNSLPFAMAGIAWNLRKPLFQNPKLRLALAHLFNRERLIKDFFFDQYQLASGPAYFGSQFHHPKNLPVTFDPETAKQLLKEAGWDFSSKTQLFMKEGKPLAFEILTGNPPAAKYLAFYQEDLRKVGIQASVRVVDWASYLRLRNSGEFDAIDFSRNRDEAMRDLEVLWHSRGASDPASGNVMGLKDPAIDELLGKIRSATHGKERTRLIQELDFLVAHHYPMAFSWEPKFQRIAYWDQYHFAPPGYQAYSRWNQLFNTWSWKSKTVGGNPK